METTWRTVAEARSMGRSSLVEVAECKGDNAIDVEAVAKGLIR